MPSPPGRSSVRSPDPTVIAPLAQGPDEEAAASPWQPISNWKELAGKTLVMPDPDSITSVVTRAMLREQGLQEGAVKLSNTRYQDAVPFYVQNGFTAYGATASAGVVKAWKTAGGHVCAESRAVPIKQWLVSSKLDVTAAATVREALLELAQSEGGKRALVASSYSGFVAPRSSCKRSRWRSILCSMACCSRWYCSTVNG